MKKSKRMGLGVLLAAVLVMSLAFAATSSGNANGQEVKLPDEQRATVVTNIANEPGIGELPMPVFREDVIVYFKEMPDIGAFASKYRGRVIFIKPDIKMAVFETNPTGRTGQVSQRTLDFINETLKDSSVEKSYHDGFMFIRPEKVFSPEPQITYPEDFDIKGLAYAPKEVKVGFWRLPSSLEEFASKNGAKLVYVEDVLLFAVFETDNTTEFIKKISNDPYVRHAEPNGIVYSGGHTPNDTNWNLQWGPQKIYTPEAWDYQKGSTSVAVAVLDTGVDYNHEDLAGRVYQGYDFVNNDSDPMDDNNHGTHVAGIAGAIMDNGKGIAGVAQSNIFAVKVLDNNDTGTWGNLARGIRYAANNSAKIISMSIWTYSNDSDGEAACNYAYYTKGSLLVGISGNDGIQQVAYPAAYDTVIAVGATDSTDQRWISSNYGSKLELVAPGVNIESTLRNNGYGYGMGGTSMAAPHVSGVAALIWSQNPSFDNTKVREVLRNTVVDLGTAGRDIYYGYGKVNAYGAVTKGKLLTNQSGTITSSGGNSQYSINIPAPSTVSVVMAGNENSDFDLYAKWGSPPTTSSYDSKSDSSYSLEYFPIHGSGTLYVMVKSYSGTGSWKSWVIGGLYTDSGKKQGTLSGTGVEATYSLNGAGIGYAFNSGPDGSNFDLYTKWYSPPTTSSYDARGNTLGAQEIAGPAPFGNGTNYFMVHSTSGSGEYVTAGMIY